QYMVIGVASMGQGSLQGVFHVGWIAELRDSVALTGKGAAGFCSGSASAQVVVVRIERRRVVDVMEVNVGGCCRATVAVWGDVQAGIVDCRPFREGYLLEAGADKGVGVGEG